MTSVIEVHLRSTRGENSALEQHLVYGSGAFLVHHRPNLVADLQHLCGLVAKFCVNALQMHQVCFAGNNPSNKRGSLLEFPISSSWNGISARYVQCRSEYRYIYSVNRITLALLELTHR